MTLKSDNKIFVSGHNGMVGSALVKCLKKNGYSNIIKANRKELDLLNQNNVYNFFDSNKIDAVFICSAKVGGIYSNSTYPYDFIYQNQMIQNNIINAAHLSDINNLLFMGSSCIYPKLATQPIHESQLLTGPLEPTNQWYALAKISGIKLCEGMNIQFGRDYRSLMPTNLYGPNDNFHDLNSHVIPALVRRFYEAVVENRKSLKVWGSGKPKREFLHVDDLAKASVFLMEMDKQKFNSFIKPDLSHINVGTGNDISIEELVSIIRNISKYDGEILFDDSKPDGTMKKVLDISTITSMGWSPEISLEDGLLDTYEWYKKNKDTAKKA
ncbi:MAG: GDP-fucose synthetase [Candidatus Marinimicrobia bacterium]|nr:GDP-fucose synthetase [Candidatus Neomarinimicrobiota bacterium]|tara:strand:- start:2066 stop:3043 length:978 start_codon:yes stop_codon:yes gene_type:complete